MVFHRIDRGMKSFAGGGLLAPTFKPPPTPDFFPFPSSFTASSQFAPHPSSKSSNIFHFDPSPTSNRSLSAQVGGQHFYDKPHYTSSDVDMLDMDFGTPHPTMEEYLHQRALETQNHRTIAHLAQQPTAPKDCDQGLPVDPDLQYPPLEYTANYFDNQAMNNAVVAAQQNIQAAPIAPIATQEPIAQGISLNGAFGAPFSETAFNGMPVAANQFANMVPAADPPKVEQLPDFEHDSEDVSEDESDVDAEGEPADLQLPAGLPQPTPMAPETVAAIAHLSAVPAGDLALAISQLQIAFQHKQDSMMTGQEMDIDQPQHIDGIPAFADALLGVNAAQNVQGNDNEPLTIDDIPLPDNTRESRNDYLRACRDLGASYGEIKRRGNFTEAESTLRGRYRTMTKSPGARVRKPIWKQKDADLLRRLTYAWFDENKKQHGRDRPPWKVIAQRMYDQGASYHFGSGTVAKMWAYIYPIDVQSALNNPQDDA